MTGRRFTLLVLALVVGLQAAVAGQVSILSRSVPQPEGTLLTSSTAQQATGANTTETTLWTWTLPADTLNEDGKAIRIRAWGSTAANTNTKTITLKWGGTTLRAGNTTSSGAGWSFDTVIARQTATAQRTITELQIGGATTNPATTAGSETLSSAIAITVTGTNSVASASEITILGATVELLQQSNGLITGTGGGIANPLLAPDGTQAAPSYTFGSDTDSGFFRSSADAIGLTLTGSTNMLFGLAGPILHSGTALRWGSTGTGSPDLFLQRDAANVLAQRNGTTQQAFRLYDTYTDNTNYERLEIRSPGASNAFILDAAAAGTGSTNGVNLAVNGTNKVLTRETDVMFNDDVIFAIDNTYDIGASGANRPRNVRVGTGVLVGDGSASAPSLAFGDDSDTGFYRIGSGSVGFSSNTTTDMIFDSAGLSLHGNDALMWGSSGAFVQDVFLTRDQANALALRNGTNAQSFRAYNTYTDSSNYERATMGWGGSNNFYIGTESAGTGSIRNFSLRTNGTDRWSVSTGGHWLAATDNTYDIGATGGAFRPRDIFVGSRVIAPTFTFINGAASGQGSITTAADGVFTLSNAAGTDFGRLQFGGSTSAFPAWKRSGATFEARFADDSGYAIVTAAAVDAATPGGGFRIAAATGAGSDPAANYVKIYAREDISVAGTATADCVLRARVSDTTEVTIVVIKTDAPCP